MGMSISILNKYIYIYIYVYIYIGRDRDTWDDIGMYRGYTRVMEQKHQRGYLPPRSL